MCIRDSGSVLWHGCIIDITETKEAEDERMRNRAELKAVYDNAPIIMCVVDADHRVRYGNSAFLRYVDNPETVSYTHLTLPTIYSV